MIGKTLGGRYEIIEELGSGGTAVVYKGLDASLGRPVTIKILRAEYTTDYDFVRRFQHEARAVASLCHPNIVSLYDVGQEGNIHYLVMEYVHGDNLKAIIAKEGPLSPARAIHIVCQVCEALTHAHENNIVHRDVKPHNILITREGWAKLSDFGIARDVTGTTLTYTSSFIGSVHYLSPEQARGQLADQRSDLYSLGVVLYEMLTGSVPYQGDNLIAVALKHIQDEPERPSKLNEKITPQLEEVILRAIAKDPSKRFQNGRELSLLLRESLSKNKGEPAENGAFENTATGLFEPLVEEEEKEEPDIAVVKKRKMRTLSVLIGSLLLILIVAGAAFAFNKFYFNIPEIKVPDIVNKSQEEAEKTLTELGLKVQVVKEHNDDVAEGYVIDQDIGPDDPAVKPPRLIKLTVSLGKDLREVPGLYKLTILDAKAQVTRAGLKISEPVQEGNNDNVTEGCIYQQYPSPGEKKPAGSYVTVYVSLGKNVAKTQVPRLIGLTIEQARAELSKTNLKLDEKFEWADFDSADYLSGQILSQEPEAGSDVTEDTAVKVVLSRGPGPSPNSVRVKIPVPDDGRSHDVRISLEDIRGTKDVYVNSHAPGDEVSQVVRYYGGGTIRVYIDGSMVKDQNL
ncbi:MAG TPA: Stk1 family PASTA domain-containing Ser/Thr kinase [Desulfotomaculum sp.]|nr:MAG: Serine/threonine protein kinase with PASTA sensor(S) [Desulfotomaculum sp. 46_80]HAG09837.1 Stk1 family PASTA domain-containing Ser/Thr kinase [Desulfotomaculum sp.]HBY03888.1 Stk1 family PASTA domain-containing Ser/Thr kinase [Desulfotomaculum sp.]